MRQARDPIEHVKKLLIDLGFSTAEELKAVEKTIRSSVEESLNNAKKGTFPPKDWLISDIYSDNAGKSEPLKYIRMPNIANSYVS